MFKVFKIAFKEWKNGKASQLGAALAYFGAFALAPLLIVVLGIVGLVFHNSSRQSQLVNQTSNWLGSSSTTFINTVLQENSRPGVNRWEITVGFITSLFGAIGLLKQLKQAVNQIWQTESATHGIIGFVKEELSLLVLLISSGILITASVILGALASHVGRSNYLIVVPPILIQGIAGLTSLLIILGVCSLFFKFLPIKNPTWPICLWSGLLSAILFTFGRVGLTFYLEKVSFNSTFGAASSLAALLFWLFYTAQIFLFGAAFSKALTLTKPSEVAFNPVKP